MLHLEKLLTITKRGDAISARVQIAMLEFSAAVEADDPVKGEEIRLKLHQLIDDQLDLQLEVHAIKRGMEKRMMEKFRKDLM